MAQIKQKREELIAMTAGKNIILPPLIGVRFEDTGEEYYFTRPKPQQLNKVKILFPYKNKAEWQTGNAADEVLYNRKGQVVYGKKEE